MRKSYIAIRPIVLSALTVTATLATAALAITPAAASALTPFIPPTPVSACGTLNAPGGYILTSDLGPVPGTCLVVSAPGVTLNLAGHTVAGMKLGTSAGIRILPSAVHATVESTVPGAAVVDFHAGIQDYASNAVITGPYLLLAHNAGAGVYLYNVTSSLVQGAQLDGNGHFGANIQLGRDVTVRGDQVVLNGRYGIWALSTVGSQFTHNAVGHNRVAGIYLGCSDTANLQDVGCPPSDGDLVQGNTLRNNGPFGIAISDVSLDNKIQANNASGDTQAGLWDENYGCGGPSAPPNSWQQNTGTRNQSASPTCIG